MTQGIGGIVGNYTAGFLKNITGDFMWYYVVVAVAAVILGALTLQLPREGSAESAIGRKPATPGIGKEAAQSVG